jgi:UDP-N-acetylglucosamine acyltransferase
VRITSDHEATNRIHPTAIIGQDVRIGVGNLIGPYTVILGACTIGDDNWIGPNVCIGTPPEMRGTHHPAGWMGEAGSGPVEIGNRNVVREFTSIQGPTTGTTRLGDDCYLMDKVHIPHDCIVEDGVTISCSVMMGGHTHLGAGCNIGLSTVIHQRIAVGRGSMVGMGSVVTRHIPPYALAYGSPARVRGANLVGLSRSGFDEQRTHEVDVTLKAGGELSELLPAEAEAFMAALQSVQHP